LLAARDEKDSRKALLSSGFIVLFQFTVFLLVGVLLYVFAQHTPLLAPGESTDRILPLFLVREMPTGLAGLLLAAILAVAMSNASGSLNSLAASSVMDFAALRGHTRDPEKFVKLSRRMTLVWGVVLIFLGLVHWGPVLETGLTIVSFTSGCLLGLFLLGTFDGRSNSNGSLIGMIVGLAAVLLVARFTSVAFTWYWMIGSCVTFAAGAVASRMLPERAGAI
jgi:Na+/proline symporter